MSHPALPAQLTSFVGRRREFAEVSEAVRRARLVTLTGSGGAGKTRLALQVAGACGPRFPDGVWLADLSAVADPEQVAPAVVRALGARDQSTRSALDRVVDHLAGRRGLLVLDNCEHLVAACGRLAAALVENCPQVVVLATSRRPLRAEGEHVVTVPPLEVPPDGDLPLDVLPAFGAVRLLLDRAAAAGAAVALTPDSGRAVAALCRRLDGLPLAIELAAVRLRTISAKELAERLDDRVAVLGVGHRTAVPRHRTLSAVTGWSWDLCSPDERLLWARMSVCAAGFDLEAAEAIGAVHDLPAVRIPDALEGLVDQCLLTRTGHGASARYVMLETIRRYGRARLADLGVEDPVRRSHRAHYLALAIRGGQAWAGPGQELFLARMRSEHSNLRAAFDHFRLDPGTAEDTAEGAAEGAARLAGALCWSWAADGLLSEGRRWLDEALALPGEGPARADACRIAAWVALLQGDRPAAAARLDEARALARRHDLPATRAHVRSIAATAALFEGRPREADRGFAAAIAVLERHADAAAVTFALFQRSVCQALIGDYADAEATAAAGVARSSACGDRLGRSYSLWAKGFAAWSRGDPGAARADVRAALGLQVGFRDGVGAALMVELLAWASGEDPARSAYLLGAAASLWQGLGTGMEAFGPHLADSHRRVAASVRAALGALRFTAAYDDGRRVPADLVVGVALGGPTAVRSRQHGDRAASAAPRLTRREREVAELLADGMSNREIAERLVLSPRTVEGHVEHLLAKLGISSRSSVAAALAAHDHRP